ncbi:sulfite exporter TauE/SafE family protein [beta proteobacterium MWH-UniP1]
MTTLFSLYDLSVGFGLFLGAVLYTSVGHGGASAYIAIMSLFGMSAAAIKPTALTLNIFVSSYTSFQFIKAKLYDLKLVIPLLIGAVPCAFLGGRLNLPSDIYKPIVGIILLYSAYRFIATTSQTEQPPKPYKKWLAVVVGGVIGFLSGLTGTGGGIFLSPLILFAGWTRVKGASGTAAIFIFFNSLFGLLGNISSVSQLPAVLPLYVAFVLLGAFIGTRFGIHYFAHVGVKRALGVVLLIAGLKLTLGL